MIFRPELVRRIAVQHELNIVLSIRNPHIDPAQLLGIRASAPRLLKAQYLAVKVHGPLTVPNEEAKMIDLRSNARVRFELARRLRFKAIRKRLDKLNKHAIRVLDLERIVSSARLSAVARFHIKTFRPQVGAHRFDIVDDETKVAHHIRWMSGRFIEQLNVLMVVDLDKGNASLFAVLLREAVRLVEAKKVMPERDRLRKIGNKIADVRDAYNPRTRRPRLCEKRRRKQQHNRQAKEKRGAEELEA